eukprot:4864175-Alexandrium_andersonii.AAC.1
MGWNTACRKEAHMFNPSNCNMLAGLTWNRAHAPHWSDPAPIKARGGDALALTANETTRRTTRPTPALPDAASPDSESVRMKATKQA